MKRLRVVALFVIAVMLIGCLGVFVGCKDNKEEEKDLVDVTFLLDWAPNTNHTGLYVAKNLGYFKDEGLNVSIVQPGNMGTSGSVAAGTAEFGIDFQEQMIFNESQGVEVTAIGSIIQHNTSGLVSAKADGIDSAAKMEGKKYATWEAPGEQAIVRQMMIAAGKDPNTLEMVPKFVENIVAEFEVPNGVDLVWSFAGWDLVKLRLAGVETNFIEMRNIENLDYYTPVIVANNKFIKNNPELVKAFMKAATKGYTYAIENPIEAANILMEENPELKSDKEIIYESAKYLAQEYKSDAPKWGYIDQARWDGFFNMICDMKSTNPDLPSDITDGYGFTNEFLPEV